ncbi:MAG: hypothetical protein QM704_25475 [Anaeromyxobacteraceae bacterium]
MTTRQRIINPRPLLGRWRLARRSPAQAAWAEEDAQFGLTLTLPPLENFASLRRDTSPVSRLVGWIDGAVGAWTHPSDVLMHREDLTAMRALVREWLHAFHGLRGDRLRREVNMLDVGGLPREARRTDRNIAPGCIRVRRRARP